MEIKKPFEFKSIVPCYDWYDEIHHKINQDDYIYFKLERRFGPSWWLYGMKTVEEPDYHWEETEIGEIYNCDLYRFIEWAKMKEGSRIIDVHMISGDFDIFNIVGELSNRQLLEENKRLKKVIAKAVNGLHGNCKECVKKDTCTERRGRHDCCWEWRYKEDAEIY